MAKKSIFTDLLNNHRTPEQQEIEGSTTLDPSPQSPQPDRRTVGRPRGRRSDPAYTQLGAYVPYDLFAEVQDILTKRRRRQRKKSGGDMSDLIEELLREWLKNNQE